MYLSALPSVSTLLIRRLSTSCIVYTAGSNVTAEELAALRGVNQNTLFDYMSAKVDVNLKIGSPGKHLLNKSKEYMKTAALHRLIMLCGWSKGVKPP